MYPGDPYWTAADILIRIISWNLTGEEMTYYEALTHVANWF